MSTEYKTLHNSFFVRAIYNYHSDDPSALLLSRGDIIKVLAQIKSGWWDGIIVTDDGTLRGWFPGNYVSVISEAEAKTGLGKHWPEYKRVELDENERSGFEDAPEPDERSTVSPHIN